VRVFALRAPATYLLATFREFWGMRICAPDVSDLAASLLMNALRTTASDGRPSYCGDGVKASTRRATTVQERRASDGLRQERVHQRMHEGAPLRGWPCAGSFFEDCDGSLNCSATCTNSVLH
jgi:hypothetical protein